jgi:hypothetical protein
MGNMNPFRIGVIALVVAAAMYVIDLMWRPVFTLRVSQSFELPLWILCMVFGALQLFLWHVTRSRLTLSDDEVAKWGSKLESATSTILEQAKASRPVREIAEDMKAAHGIPEDVTLRYIIALGHTNQAE